MDHFGTGRLLCRGGQRAAVGETRRVERPAVPYAPCRSQGAVRIEIPALQDPAHTRGAAAGGAYHRHRPHAARSGRDGARDAPAHGPRLPGGKQGGVPRNRPFDPQRRLRDNHLHVGHHGRPKRRRADAPQLHGQRRTVALAHRHPAILPDAHHPAAGSLLRACRGVLYHDRMRGDGRNRAGGRHTDGDAQEHPAEHPRGAAAFPAVGAGAGQEFPQEHRILDPRQGAFHGTALQFRAPHGLCLQQGRVQQRDTAGA